MHNRPRNWLVAAGGVALVWIAQPIWSRNLDYFLEKRGWEKTLDTAVGSMSEWMTGVLALLRLDGFWGGAFTVLAIWGCLESVYAVQRTRRVGAISIGISPISISQGVYVARVVVAATQLVSDRVMQFGFVAFNGTGLPLRLLLPVQGHVAYGSGSAIPDTDLVTLPPPTAQQVYPLEFPAYGEVTVLIEQRVPGELAMEIDRALSNGERIKFVLEGLNILLQGEGQAEPVRLPVWDQITCDQVTSESLGPMVNVMAIRIGRLNVRL